MFDLDQSGAGENPLRTGRAGTTCAAMHRHFFSLRIAGLVVLAAIAVGSLDLWWRGFVVVHDPAGVLAGGAIRSVTGERQDLRKWTPNYWVARPRFEAELVLRCRDGTEVLAGPVARRGRTGMTVAPERCRQNWRGSE